MAELLKLYSHQFLVFVLVLTRISGVVLLAPALSSKSIPARIRGFLAVAMSMIVTPLLLDVDLPEIGSMIDLTVLAGRELAIGLAIGLATMILFSGVQLAGQLISQTAGISLADIFDPNFESSVSSITQLMDLLAVCIFLCMGGHRQVLAAVLDTFHWSPPGNTVYPSDLVTNLTAIMSQSLATAIRAGAPCLLSLLIAVLVTAIISRTLPQLNVFALGFNLNVIVLMLGLAASMGAGAWIFQDQVSDVLNSTLQNISGAGQGRG